MKSLCSAESFDWIAAVKQNALVAVDESDGALARGGGAEARVEGKQVMPGVQRLNVHGTGSERAFQHWQAAVALLFRDHCIDVFGCHIMRPPRQPKT